MASKNNIGALTAKKVAQFKLSHSNILEEIPIKIHNAEITKALLCELAKDDNGASAFEKLDLSVNPYLEKHVESLQDELESMIGEMDKLHDYLKGAQLNKQKKMKFLQERKAINKERKKSGLEPLVRATFGWTICLFSENSHHFVYSRDIYKLLKITPIAIIQSVFNN